MLREAETYALGCEIETWWVGRWRESLWKARSEKDDLSLKNDAKTDARETSNKANEPSNGDPEPGESEDESFELDEQSMRASTWPPHLVRHPQTRKGPLPGDVDPEGILGTVPLLDDILAFFSTAKRYGLGPFPNPKRLFYRSW